MALEEINLTAEQAVALVVLYEAYVHSLTVANNAMLHEISCCDGLTEEHIAALNRWSDCVNELGAQVALQIEYATAPVN
ncbi:MAG: hypothetical protein M9924_14855 [Rhizobiaceae bacterium]|nr:hypothetical protein [Rhizobiaceae bacterium]